MKLNAHCDYYADNSYFLFNKKNQITYFSVHSLEKIGHFLCKDPVIGEPFVEIVSHRYAEAFSKLVMDCFTGKSFNIEKRLKVDGKEDILLQIVLTPIFMGADDPYVSCTVIDSNRKSNQMKLLDEYSHLASHDLRAPITNILSLSSLLNYPEMEGLETGKITGLLKDINLQAEKLDDIIKMLNRLINKGQSRDADFMGETMKTDSKHIMLVDDDSLTNKLHHMIITKNNKNRNIVQFDNPALALEYLNENRPDLILLDLNMPDIDGWAFLKRLEENKIEIDVVIVSSTIDPAERTRAQSYRMVKDFLTKPMTYDKIKHLLDS